MSQPEPAKSKVLPKEITSYDLYKSLAVFIMVVDHIGLYFWPDDLWFRAFGNSPAIWIFLIGFANSRRISGKLVFSAFFLVGITFFLGAHVFPVNILFAVILARLCLDKVADWLFYKGAFCFFAGLVLMWVSWLFSFFIFDYGTLFFSLALFGYALLHKDELPNPEYPKYMFVNTVMFYLVVQSVMFDFSHLQWLLMAVSTGAMMYMSYKFEPKIYPELTARLPGFLVKCAHLCGRRTLEIYVIHLLIFQIIAAYFGLADHGFFRWDWL